MVLCWVLCTLGRTCFADKTFLLCEMTISVVNVNQGSHQCIGINNRIEYFASSVLCCFATLSLTWWSACVLSRPHVSTQKSKQPIQSLNSQSSLSTSLWSNRGSPKSASGIFHIIPISFTLRFLNQGCIYQFITAPIGGSTVKLFHDVVCDKKAVGRLLFSFISANGPPSWLCVLALVDGKHGELRLGLFDRTTVVVVMQSRWIDQNRRRRPLLIEWFIVDCRVKVKNLWLHW